MKPCFILLTIFIAGCNSSHAPQPAFVVNDPNFPDESLAVFVPYHKLHEHGVDAEEYEKLFRGRLDEVGKAVAFAFADFMVPTENSDQEPSMVPERILSCSILTEEVFDDLLKHTRAEVWRKKPDGTHEVVKSFPNLSNRSELPPRGATRP